MCVNRGKKELGQCRLHGFVSFEMKHVFATNIGDILSYMFMDSVDSVL